MKNITELFNIVDRGLELFDELIKSLPQNAKLSLEELADSYSKKLDTLILKQEKENNYQYIGGELKIYYIDIKYFGIYVSLYFQDENKQWKKTSIKSNPQKAKYIRKDAFEELISKRTIVFEVEPPKNEDFIAK